MAHIVDYSADWQHTDGVELGTYTPPGGSPISTLRALRGSLTTSDLQTIIGVSPGDAVFWVWLATIAPAQLVKEATILIGSVTYTVITWSGRADDAQAKVFCRKRRQ